MSDDRGIGARTEPPTGTRLAVEIGTTLVLDLPGVEVKIKTILVGMQAGEYLILKPPRALNVKLFQIGKVPRAIVRYVFSGRVFGFETPMIGAILDPVGLVFLGYPKNVHEHNLRSAQRVECQLPAKVQFNASELAGVVLDISLTGCRVSVKAATLQGLAGTTPVLDSILGIDIQLPWESGTLSVHGKIKNMEQDAARIILGVAFDPVGAAAGAQISRYIGEAG